MGIDSLNNIGFVWPNSPLDFNTFGKICFGMSNIDSSSLSQLRLFILKINVRDALV